MADRKRLSDILPFNTDRERLEKAWAATKVADDLKPIPAGEYRCAVISGEPFNARTSTPGYKLTLEVLDGEYAGRRVWHDIWLSERAMERAKRGLGRLGIEQLADLDRPLPRGMVVVARVALNTDDKGNQRNKVSRFDVVAVEPPEPDPFAPKEDVDNADEAATHDEDNFDWRTGEQTEGSQE